MRNPRTPRPSWLRTPETARDTTQRLAAVLEMPTKLLAAARLEPATAQEALRVPESEARAQETVVAHQVPALAAPVMARALDQAQAVVQVREHFPGSPSKAKREAARRPTTRRL